MRFGFFSDALKYFRRIEFRHGAAGLANQQCRGLALMGMGTGHKGIAAFDLVDEAVGEEEIKSAVNRDGCRAAAMLGHALDNVVGANGGVTLRDGAQNFTALAGQFAAAPLAGALGPGDQIGGAVGVVMVGVKEGHTVII